MRRLKRLRNLRKRNRSASIVSKLATSLGSLAAVGATALVWSQVERRWPVLREYTMEVPQLTAPFTILQVADPHFYPGQEWLVHYFHQLAQLDFDFVVATGDNFGSLQAWEMTAKAFAPLLRKPGAFVFGSNDYFSPIRKSWTRYLSKSFSSPLTERNMPDLPWERLRDLFTASGWVDANNAAGLMELPVSYSPRSDIADLRFPRALSALPAKSETPLSSETVKLAIVGVDDPHIHRDRMPQFPADWLAVTEGTSSAFPVESRVFKLGLTHAPYRRILDAFAQGQADLVLAGHTHGGQLAIPFYGALVTNCDLPREFAKGLFTWSSQNRSVNVHVSAGLGTSPYAPVRFACRPEATLLHLVPAKRK